MSMTVMVVFNGNDVSLTFGRYFLIIRPESKFSLGKKYSSENEVFLHQKLAEKYWVIYNDLLRVITHFPSFQVQSAPKSNFPYEKSIFPHLHFQQIRQFSFSASFGQTQKLNNNFKFFNYKDYSLKVHVSNFRNGRKLTCCGGNST